MSDPFLNLHPDLGAPIFSLSFAITPGTAYAFPSRALFVPTGAGTLTLTTADDGNSAALVFGAGWAGGLLPIRASAVASWTGSGSILGFA